MLLDKYGAANFLLPVGSIFILTVIVLLMVKILINIFINVKNFKLTFNFNSHILLK